MKPFIQENRKDSSEYTNEVLPVVGDCLKEVGAKGKIIEKQTQIGSILQKVPKRYWW